MTYEALKMFTPGVRRNFVNDHLVFGDATLNGVAISKVRVRKGTLEACLASTGDWMAILDSDNVALTHRTIVCSPNWPY